MPWKRGPRQRQWDYFEHSHGESSFIKSSSKVLFKDTTGTPKAAAMRANVSNLQNVSSDDVKVKRAKTGANVLKKDGKLSSKKKTRSFSKKTFDKHLAELKEFRATHGHCIIMHTDGKTLRQWCLDLRKKHGKGDLTSDQIRALNDIGFIWTNNGQTFDRRLSKLCVFKAKHGHCNVPMHTTLGVWCKYLRLNYRSFKRGECQNWPGTKLTMDEVRALDTVGFDFEGRT